MNGYISIGSVMIPLSTAYKAAVLGFLGTIAASLAYIVYWLST